MNPIKLVIVQRSVQMPPFPDDAPSIGMILCRGRDATVVEYSLRDTAKPMGVARYELRQEPPLALAEALPTVEELTRDLDDRAPREAVAHLKSKP